MIAKIFSFFSGAGFLDLGFELSGYDIVFANELYEPFADGYEYSRKRMGIKLPKYGLERLDVCKYLQEREKLEELKSRVLSEKETGLVGFIGGPPCPDFSVAGKNAGSTGKHGILSQVYMDIICSVRPDFFLFENVKGLWRTAKHRKFFDELIKQAKSNDYDVTYRLVNSLEYGAPQDRDRIIIIGINKQVLRKNKRDISEFPWGGNGYRPIAEIKSFPWPQTSEFNENKTDCPKGIPIELTAEYWFNKNDVVKHPNANDYFKPKAALDKVLWIPEGDDSRKSYKRLHRWRYSPTVAYGNNEVHWHPYRHRRLSAAEALALQSLPKEFVLPPDMTLTAKFKTIGNGVPFLLSKSIAERLAKFIDKEG